MFSSENVRTPLPASVVRSFYCLIALSLFFASFYLLSFYEKSRLFESKNGSNIKHRKHSLPDIDPVIHHESLYSRRTYHSHHVSHILPFNDFTIKSIDKNGNSKIIHDDELGFQKHLVNSDKAKHLSSHGHHQLFDDKISIKFTAFNQTFSFDNLKLQHSLIEPHSKIIVHEVGPDGRTVDKLVQHQIASYLYISNTSAEFVSLTLSDQGAISLIHHTGNDTIQIDHVDHHKDYMHPLHYDELKNDAVQNHLVFRHSDLNANISEMECKQKIPPADDEDDDGRISDVTNQSLLNRTQTIDLTPTVQIAKSPIRHLLNLERWADCYPHQEMTRTFSIGFAADYTFVHKQNNNIHQVMNIMAQQLSHSNAIYLAQMNIMFQVVAVIIEAGMPIDGPNWNHNQPPSPGHKCAGTTMDKLLDDFSKWRKTEELHIAASFNLFTNCFPSPGLFWELNLFCFMSKIHI